MLHMLKNEDKIINGSNDVTTIATKIIKKRIKRLWYKCTNLRRSEGEGFR